MPRAKKNTKPEIQELRFDSLEAQTVYTQLSQHLMRRLGLKCSFLVPVDGSQNHAPFTLYTDEPEENVISWISSLFAHFVRQRFEESVFRKSKDHELCALIPFCDPRNGNVIGYVAVSGLSLEQLSGLTKRILTELELVLMHLAFVSDYSDVQNKIFIDDVTVLYNQRYLPMVLENEISRSQRLQSRFSVLFIDIDYFKSVNDTRGHLVGSKILQEMGQVLKKMIRTHDYAFRYGGDEFVILLTEADATIAKVVAERIRKCVEDYSFKVDDMTLKVTVSIGVAVFPDHAQSAEKILKLADQAMYSAKHKSRNFVFVAS